MTERILWKLAGSLWMLICSAITYNKIGEISLASLLVMPETLIFLIFGLLHALLIYISEEIVRNHFNLKENLFEKLLSFVSDTILYSSFYRLVLLPACGLGFLEWGILLLFFASEFGVHFHVGLRTKDKIYEKDSLISLSEAQLHSIANEKSVNPFQLSIMGLVLWGFKIIIRYAFPQNLYYSLVGNKTIMNIVIILFVLLVFYGIKRLKDCIFQVNSPISSEKKAKTGKKSPSQTASSVKIFLKTVLHLIQNFIAILGTLLTGPAAIVVLIVFFTIFGFGGFFFIHKIRSDILKFLTPILSTVLSVDNAGYTETNLNTLGQCAAIMIFFLQQFSEKYFHKKQLENSIEEKWYETIEDVSNLPCDNNLTVKSAIEKQLFDSNILEIRKILRKQILRNDLASTTKVKFYELLTKGMSAKEVNNENEVLIKGLLEE